MEEGDFKNPASNRGPYCQEIINISIEYETLDNVNNLKSHHDDNALHRGLGV